MRALILSIFVLVPSLSLASMVLIVECDNNVEVYGPQQISTGSSVVIQYEKAGRLYREDGTLSIRSDKSLVANSNSVVVYGNPQGTGYFILAPSRKLISASCLSADF